MSKKVAIIISPNYKDYAKKYLADCINSIMQQDYKGEIKVFITDNETSEESHVLLKKIAPEAKIHRNKHNDGFAKGCNDSIKEALRQGFDYIAIINIHTVIKPNYISELVKVAENSDNIGAVQGLMLLDPPKNKINSLGNDTHFLGFGYCRGYNQELSSGYPELSSLSAKDIFYPSGSSFFIKRKVLEKVGLFDEEFWMYNEDQDLGWRVWLAGFKCVLAYQAVLYNKYEFARSIQKYYWMDRNRIIAMIKNYHLLTLLLITPACLVMELGLILFSLKTGWFREKVKVWRYFLTPAKWKYLYQARKETQRLRKVKDKDIVKMIVGTIWYQEIDDAKLRLINPVFSLYWRMVRRLIFW